MNALLARAWVGLILSTAAWPQSRRTKVARWIGEVLWVLVIPRRRITLANLRACFPEWTERQCRDVGRRLFHNIARSILDHGVLWRGSRDAIRDMVRMEGDGLAAFGAHGADGAGGDRPLILLAPHFAGLDAGGIRISTERRCVTLYARQSNPVWDHWLTYGRARFNAPLLIAKHGADLRTAVRAMRDGLPFYYLPDMDHGAQHSIFVPFFGVSAATLPMVSRLARMTGARVAMVVSEMRDEGYVVHFEAPWADYPGNSVEADTARMNRELERWVLRLPDQYLWTHRRFKTRPAGAPSLYG